MGFSTLWQQPQMLVGPQTQTLILHSFRNYHNRFVLLHGLVILGEP